MNRVKGERERDGKYQSLFWKLVVLMKIHCDDIWIQGSWESVPGRRDAKLLSVLYLRKCQSFLKKMNTAVHGDSLYKIIFIPLTLLELFLNKITVVGFDTSFSLKMIVVPKPSNTVKKFQTNKNSKTNQTFMVNKQL